ncbi:MAG: hypothetical protein HoeaKO_43990 [Hoeflea alexandrii]
MLSAAECNSVAFMVSSGLLSDGIEPVVICPFDAQPARVTLIAAMQTAESSRRGKTEL